MTNYKFVQPVSMQVNQEQFDYLKPKLEAMGYYVGEYQPHYTFIGNYYNGNNLEIKCIHETAINDYNRHFIDHYNPELFLAIAAMTDAEYGIAGEHWIHLSKIDEREFKQYGIYISTKPVLNSFAILDNNGNENGYSGRNLKHFKKATLPELINHYTKTKTDMSTTRNVAFTLEQAKALYEKDKAQYAWLLPTFPELEQPKELVFRFKNEKDAKSFQVDSAQWLAYYKVKVIEPKKD